MHIPFCKRKCSYCAFYSITDLSLTEQYVNALIAEITAVSFLHKDKIIKTIYLGGGTPSILSCAQIERIVDVIYKCFCCETEEITIEVNPDTASFLSEYKTVGFNRVSIGVQSTDDDILRIFGRLHNSQQALDALRRARNIFDNVSADLIIGCKNAQSSKEDFLRVKDYITHLSAYILSLEPNTPLYSQFINKTVSIATEDSVICQYNELVETARMCGFLQYEISNFALPGYESKHNSSYWNLTPYLGFGCSAHSYVNGERYYNDGDIIKYISGSNSSNDGKIIERNRDIREDEYEYIMLSLRTARGVALNEFRDKFNKDFVKSYSERIDRVKKYLSISEKSIGILPQYYLLENRIESIILD